MELVPLRLRLAQVAALAGVSVGTVRKHLYGWRISPSLAGMPPACSPPGAKPAFWHRDDILDWLNGQRMTPPAALDATKRPLAASTAAGEADTSLPAQKRVGRPRRTAA